MAKKDAFLISFEGIEGSGKSTQCRLLSNYLRKKGLKVAVYREPGSSTVGEYIRQILLHGQNKLTNFSETILFIAARAQLKAEKIEPDFKSKDVIILDRYIDATLAYQGYGSGIDQRLIKRLNKLAVCNAVPKLTILLDLNPEMGIKRSGRKDRFEKRKLAFHKRVRKGYLDLAKQNSRRIKVVCIKDRNIHSVQQQIRSIVFNAFCKRR